MGRNKAKVPFKGKPIDFYQPTDGQAAAMYLASANKGDNTKTLIRFFKVLEALTAKAEDWSWMEDQMVEGSASVEDFTQLLSDIFAYEWPETEDGGK